MINKDIDSERQLTIHVLYGRILIQELSDAVKELYNSGPTLNHLWDLTEADLSQIRGDDLRKLATFVKRYAPARVGGRTALVAINDLGFGLSRMYEVFAEISDQQVEIKVFRSRKEAEKWISSGLDK